MLFDPNSGLAGSSGNASSSLYRSMEFIAVIFAGEGSASASGRGGGPASSSSSGLEAGGDGNGNADDEAESSKAAIQPPILQRAEGGKPQIDGVLKWIEEAGVTDAVILAPEYQHQGLTSYLRTRKNSGPKDILPGEIIAAPLQPMLRVDLQTWEEDDDTETEALRKWAEKSPYKHADLIILPPDFMERFGNKHQPALPPLATLLDRHRVDEALITTLLSERKPIISKKQQKEASEAAPPVLIAYDSKTSTLLDIRDMDEFDGDEENVSVRSSLLRRYPILSLSTKLQLSHIYVCSRHVLNILHGIPELKLFEEQALRWLCKAQWQSKLQARQKEQRREHSQSEALWRSSTSCGKRDGRTKIGYVLLR